MGLDMYLIGEKWLSTSTKREEAVVDYLNGLRTLGILPDDDFDEENEEGFESWFVSEWNPKGKAIGDMITKHLALQGQTGRLAGIMRDGDNWGLRTDVAYWRKANQIHNWLVKHVQDGVDECQKSPLSLGSIDELVLAVTEVLKNKGKAPDILPSGSGFFFGDTSYDGWYYANLRETKKVLSKILRKDKHADWDYFYQSSW